MNNVSSAFLGAALGIIELVLNLYIWVLVIGAVLSWLIAFDVINTHNRFVRTVNEFLYRITEPLLRPIRRILPPLGGLDLSPMILIFLIIFLQSFLARLAY
ncbi:MAG TPA: YggT family protein [Alphaproteobacteria bacterium]|nr:YggT family protein [Alphaproteobacteria bacterium]